jgi:hypothetical protein
MHAAQPHEGSLVRRRHPHHDVRPATPPRPRTRSKSTMRTRHMSRPTLDIATYHDGLQALRSCNGIVLCGAVDEGETNGTKTSAGRSAATPARAEVARCHPVHPSASTVPQPAVFNNNNKSRVLHHATRQSHCTSLDRESRSSLPSDTCRHANDTASSNTRRQHASVHVSGH